jgi:hypothetical protein
MFFFSDSTKECKPKKLKKPNVRDKKQSPMRSGMQGLYERAVQHSYWAARHGTKIG